MKCVQDETNTSIIKKNLKTSSALLYIYLPIIAAYHTSNHRLTNEIGLISTIPISRNNHFCISNLDESTHFVLECPLYGPISDKFQSLFEKVILGSLKFFFQLDQQVDISLYLMKATAFCHSRELAGSTPPWCIFDPHKIFGFLDSKFDLISLRGPKKMKFKD